MWTERMLTTGDKTKAKCPECLEEVYQEELDTFGGLCEECNFELNE